MALLSSGHEVIGTGFRDIEQLGLSPALRDMPLRNLDVRDRDEVRSLVESVRPDVIYHLAAQAYVMPSYRDPAYTFEVNALGTIHLLEAVRRTCPDAEVVVACSGAEYGLPEELPIREDHPLRPVSPYGVSKATQDLLAQQYHESHGLATFCVRLFGTTGAGKTGDAANDFASQIARIEANGGRGTIRTGALSTARDISDIRDAVSAMEVVRTRGEAGEAYNIGRGEPTRIQDVLDTLLASSPAHIEVRTDETRLRPSDEPTLYPDVSKIRALGWITRYGIPETLAAVLAFWRSHLDLLSSAEANS